MSLCIKSILGIWKNTIVSYRCGSFFEIYSIDDGLVWNVIRYFKYSKQKRNKSIQKWIGSNTFNGYFPMYALNKFVGILIKWEHTVAVDQISEAQTKKRVTFILVQGLI
jgi:DNA mismatch repair ATPase MutS